MLNSIIIAIDFTDVASKVLITPTFINPGILKRSIAIEKGKVLNLKIKTLEVFIYENTLDQFKDKAYLNLNDIALKLTDILDKTKDKLNYFKGALHFPGFRRHLARLILDLRLNEADGKHLEKLENITKWQETIIIKNLYEKLLENGYYDYASCLSNIPSKRISDKLFIIDSQYSKLEVEAIDTLGMTIIKPGSSEASKPKLNAFCSETIHQECLQITRQISNEIKLNTSTTRIGICVPDYDSYFDALNEAQGVLLRGSINKITEKESSEDNEKETIPAGQNLYHFIKGTPVFNTLHGKLWQYLAEWIRTDYSVYGMLKILRSGVFNFHSVLKGAEPADFFKALSIFTKTPSKLVQKGFKDSIDIYLSNKIIKDEEDNAEIKTKYTDPQKNIALSLAQDFESLVPEVNEEPDETKEKDKLKQRLNSVQTFLKKYTYINELSKKSLARINNILQVICDNLNEYGKDTFEAIINDVTERMSNSHIIDSIPSFNHPIVGDLYDLKYMRFDMLYIAGLNEGGLPKEISQDPLILDEEKSELIKLNNNYKFYSIEQRHEEYEKEFSMLTESANNELILSAPLRDLSTNREKLLSRYFLEIWNRNNDSRLDFRQLTDELRKLPESRNDFIALKAEDSFYKYETGISYLHKINIEKADDKLLLKHFPSAEKSNEYISERYKSDKFGKYWGILGLDINRALPVLSASRLSAFAKCPYKYFLKYELNLDAPEEYDNISLEWLDTMTIGNFLHTLFHNFSEAMRKKRGKEYSVVEQSDHEIFTKEFDELIKTYKISNPINSEVYFEFGMKDLKEKADIFFEDELNNKNKRLYTELAYGIPKDGRDTLSYSKEPIEIDANGIRIKFRGSIDRIDETSDNKFVLIDYKTGKEKTFDESKPFAGGSLPQTGVYCEAITSIDNKISNPTFEYWYLTQYGVNKTFKVDYVKYKDKFKILLKFIIENIKTGNFPPNVVERTCSEYCDYFSVCADKRTWLFEIQKKYTDEYGIIKNIQKEEF
ncbi:MAG: PD-(D/E)XK nuclease family protein [Ignavibacteriae bacterium]|nr:PD-(D/E)XK nuclease family protein [Ignavibacteriota bacterium]